MINKDFETVEQGIEKLKKAVRIRNQMGGALFYNILNDDCYDIANKLFGMGADKEEIQKILQG